VKRRLKTPDVCPICGADVPRNARACPECGADERSGWSENAASDGLDLPNEEGFDYEKFVEEEFGGRGKIKPHALNWLWWSVAVLMLIVLLWFLFPHH
jgi:zinc-ribbon domain